MLHHDSQREGTRLGVCDARDQWQLGLHERALERKHNAVSHGVRVKDARVHRQIRLELLLGVRQVHVAEVQREHDTVDIAAQAHKDGLRRDFADRHTHHLADGHLAHAHILLLQHGRLQAEQEQPVGHGMPRHSRGMLRADAVLALRRRQGIDVFVGDVRDVHKCRHIRAYDFAHEAPARQHGRDPHLDALADRVRVRQRLVTD